MDTPLRVFENDQGKVPWDFQIHTDKMVLANQPGIAVVDKQRKTVVVVINVAIPSDSSIRKMEHSSCSVVPPVGFLSR